MFKELYRDFLSRIEIEKMMEDTGKLWQCELGQTFRNYHQSAQCALEMLQQYNIPNAEKLPFPADGKTAYQDKITPMGWEASVGRLSILKGFGFERGTVAADYEKHPFHLIKGSTATAPGGELVRIITDAQLKAGEDPSDAMVLAAPTNSPRYSDYISYYLDMGARGIISDFSANAEEAPDGIQWCNAFTERYNWHVTADDRPFLAFSITPEMGTKLRNACAKGEVLAEIECDGRRYEDTVDVVTAKVPGRRPEELWIFAHLYEPLANDNSSGVRAAIETARLVMQKGVPEYSLRLVFGLEHYGFAAYASTRGGDLRHEVIGAIDYDAMYLKKAWQVNFNCGSPAVPFYGNYLASALVKELQDEPGMPEIRFQNSFAAMYDDDTFLGDSTTGVPTLWPIRTGKSFWHNSKQMPDYIEKEPFAVGTAFQSAWVWTALNPVPEMLETALSSAREQLAMELPRITGSAQEHLARRYEILRHDMENFSRSLPAGTISPFLAELKKSYESTAFNLSDEKPQSPWREYAAQIVPRRSGHGLPFDLAKVPAKKRKTLPGSVLYSPLAAILSDMDGKRNLAEIFRAVEHETCKLLDDNTIRKQLNSIFYLARHGYVDLGGFKGWQKDDLAGLLRRVGVKRGDFLLVHSSLSAFGLIDGGPETMLQALREVLGPEGTFLLPCLNDCFVFIGGPGRSVFHPFDPDNFGAIWTGALPRYFLAHYPDEPDSGHITHRWCGSGPLAQEACAGHGKFDGPVAENSPACFALRHGGKVLHFGNSIGSTTFLHSLEAKLHLPGVQNCFCKVKKANGGWEFQMVPDNLPGHRDFYRSKPEEIKFFRAAAAEGLQISKASLGPGEALLMDLKQLDEIGTKLLQKDPFLLLCDDPECLSCKRLKRAWNGK